MKLFLWAFEEADNQVDATYAMGEDLESVREQLGEKDKRFLTEDPAEIYEAPVGLTDEEAEDLFKRIINLAMSDEGAEITELSLPSSKPS